VAADEDNWRPSGNIWVIAIIVTLGAFMEVLDTTIVNVALPHIAGSLSVSDDDATWSLTVYLIANGIVLTISGSLSRMLGRKRFFLICIAVFTAASLGCGLSTSFPQLLMFRAIQGFFGGGLQPTQQAIILDTFPPEKRQAAFSLTAIATIIAPVIGPMIGGWLTDNYSWHLIFLINVPIGILTLFGVMNYVEDSPTVKRLQKTAPPFDYIGTALIALALGSLELFTDRGEDLDWFGSNAILIAASICAMGFIFGIGYLLYTNNPVVNLRVFKDRNFAFGWIQIGIMGLVLYASAVLMPQFAQQQLGYTATWAGLVLAPGGVVLAALIPVVSKLLNRVPAKFVIAAGGLALASSLFYSSHLIPQENFATMVTLRASQTAALSLLFVPISSIAYATLPKEQEGDAAALFSMARNVFGGIGISISTAMITESSQSSQQTLVGYLNPSYQPYNVLVHQIEQAAIGTGASATGAMQVAVGQVYQILQTQVAVLAYNRVFILTGILALLMIPTALLMSNIKTKAGGAA
jgi:DHA2 family multidrug resistance protein